jgi:phosphoribosylaminoimidazole-succinocarboxamide synthase
MIERSLKLKSLELVNQGKVRDIYKFDETSLLIVASDRLSAFDVILPDSIPGKGEVLTQISNFWFNKTTHIIKNHLLSQETIREKLSDAEYKQIKNQSTLVKRLKPLPVESVIRGYIIGSGWKDYLQKGEVSGVKLPDNLKLAQKLPKPIFTPSTKAKIGDHDENITFAAAENLIGKDYAYQIRELSLLLYDFAYNLALNKGMIIADTKFEFGTDTYGELYLIDEIFTPDSSRYWPIDLYEPGKSPAGLDKQLIRDYLETLDWNKKTPGPPLPQEIITNTKNKYLQLRDMLTS